MLGSVCIQHRLFLGVESRTVKDGRDIVVKQGFGCLGVSTCDPEAVSHVIFLVDVHFESEFISVSPRDDAELREFQKRLCAADCCSENESAAGATVKDRGGEQFLNFRWNRGEVGDSNEVLFLIFG